MSNTLKDSRRTALERWLPVLIFAVMVCVRLPFLNKGIDYTDTGYNIEKYKYVFYGNGISDIGMFYTDLIGGIIYRILPAGQLLVYRVLHWVIWLVNAFLGYRIFRGRVKSVYYLLFLLALSTQLAGEMIYSYYPMSQLLLMVSVLLLLNGLNRGNNKLLFAAGFVACLNVFCRLTNVFYMVMFFGIAWYGWRDGQEMKKIIRDSLAFIFGAIFGGVLTLLLMLVFMGWDEVLRSFGSYVEVALGLSGAGVENFLGITEKSGHSLSAEIKTLVRQSIQSVTLFAWYFVGMLLGGFVLEKLLRKIGVRKSGVVTAVICVVWFCVAVVVSARLSTVIMYIVGLAATVLCLMLVVYRKDDPAVSTLALTALLLGIFSVIGTDKGFQRFFLVRNLHVGMLLLSVSELPACWEKVQAGKLKFLAKKLPAGGVKNTLRGFAVLMVLSICVNGVFTSMKTAYCDGDYRTMRSTCEDIPLVRGMVTSETRARELEEYVRMMGAEELKDREVALFGFFPLGLVIGPQQDYFEEVDPCVDYPRFSVEMLLEAIQNKEEAGVVPVIVFSHVDRIQRNRPEGTLITSEAKMAVANYMLSLHDYQVFEENEFYTVYLSNEQE